MDDFQPRPADRGSVVFFHAHPDDEAIFTGGTMARLAADGWRVVLVVATQGELGAPRAPGDAAEAVAAHRVTETRQAADLLSVARLEFLGYHDSGMLGDAANSAPGAFWAADSDDVARRMALLLKEERAVALVVYDQTGIYGHPDHVKVHEVGVRAAELAGVDAVYEVTVDREYLHFVETHLVIEAGAKRTTRGPEEGDLGLAASAIGMPTVLVTATVDVRPVLDRKRAAMGAHGSQIPETASAMRLPTEAFAAVYGYEWFVRRGPERPPERGEGRGDRDGGPIESLAGEAGGW
ncbi:MAG: PIG-L family deacetylase [Acidimicrobiales bacterium]|nr:PIG-L family deacetylase [Actinomycetota bacterium]